MKKALLLVFVILLILSLTENIGVQAFTSKGRVVTLLKETVDITGDGKKDLIVLTGIKMKSGKYKNLVIDITEFNKGHYSTKLPIGFKPNLQFVDFNQDGVKDLFASIPTNKSGVNTLQTVYILTKFKLSKLSLPEPLVLESRFVNGYKAKIKIRKTGNAYIFDLKNRKKFYEKLGIFYNGKLNEPTELMVNTFNNLQPVLLKGDKIGLKGTQKITGVTESDTIGYVESSWLYDDSQWKLVNVVVLKKIRS